ncbi:hypothetical protein AC579_1066 [Pseudocercospora musae]|uniref:tRNA (guanine(9)-N1)-methyltransferase n=1 Tax=Pseudocercospora musae TaxID=113226 RepID=A0A139H3V4_9PEZI|nr:hypothetical protein AC579_1066 [Pseudocercospora musae]
MESEERPRKMRKLSPDVSQDVIKAKANGDQGAGISDIIVTGDVTNGAKTEPNGTSSPVKDEVQGVATSGNIPERVNGSIEDGELNSLPIPSEVIPPDAGEVDDREVPLSKSQQKKLRKKAEWEARREDRKIIRKEKIQAKRERKREAKEQALAEGRPIQSPKQQTHQRAVQLPVTFLIDCDFDDLMRDGERISLASQVTRCYSDNKHAPYRAHLTICSFTGKLRERFDTVLTQNYKGWKGVRTFEAKFSEVAEKAKEWMAAGDQGDKMAGVFEKYADIDDEAKQKLKDQGEVVYLSSEADEDLMELKPYSTYIIGGLVDKNREKGICYKRARKAGIRTAKLPIGEFMEMQSRKVLATNHVNEIMIRWLECGDWGEAFVKVIPKRKGGKLKGEKDEGSPGADENSAEQGDEADGDGKAAEVADGRCD